MEWVQTTAKTVEEAKELALDQLGVADDDAEFEVLEEPRPGLFGRVRGEARVRARVRPNRPRPKLDRRERRRRSGAGDAAATTDEAREVPAAAASNGEAPSTQAAPSDTTTAPPAVPAAERHPARGRRRAEPAAPEAGAQEPPDGPIDDVADGISPSRPGSGTGAGAGIERSNGSRTGARTEGDAGASADAEAVGPAAAAFLEGLAAAMGLDAGTTIGGAEPELEVRLEGPDLGLLMGPRGQTLLAVQDLTRTVSQRGITNHGRLHVDVGGYRERRRTALARFTAQVAEQVLSSGVPRALEPMGSADRKVVHDTAATVAGVETHSEGEEPTRRVVISPAP